MTQVLPDRIEMSLGRVLPGNKPIPDSSVKDRMQWR
jgi:hypothetical protein